MDGALNGWRGFLDGALEEMERLIGSWRCAQIFESIAINMLQWDSRYVYNIIIYKDDDDESYRTV